jgi:two-component system, cell cycle response regulator DivK
MFDSGNNDFIFQADWSDKTILVADDEDINYMYLKMALLKTKAHVLRANNGKEAVDIVNDGNKKIDLILMDIKMPVMDGKEATRLIKAINNEVYIIAQTAYAMQDDKSSCFQSGCDEFLSKPVRQKILLETLAKFLT